jgi:hypothetical protein
LTLGTGSLAIILAGAALITVLAASLGGALAALIGGGAGRARPVERALLFGLLALATAGLLALSAWLFDRGSVEHLVRVKPAASTLPVAPLAAPDPGGRGPYRVLTLTYGSGSDRRRPEFAAGAALRTAPVDATPFLKGNEGWRIDARAWFWGFDLAHFPLNGRVWYPQGDGPFPLVLVVHGNHVMEEFSDPGYAYLGELLASRGFIMVSVDENFFNGSWLSDLDNENGARGWLLLEHLSAWRGWSRSRGNPFYGKVDMDDVALIGHSRGGEAAAVAALFNRLPRFPDDANVAFDFGFGIRSVIAIAPSDQQYKPAGQRTPLAGVSYLALQGAHDADVSSFAGDRQYQRVDLGGAAYLFKASLYAYRANHGQFNSVWGDADAGWPRSLLLNRRPLLAPAAQRRIAEVYVAAFLEATLHHDLRYVPLFRDVRRGAAWLPRDLYISRFQDSTFHTVADFQEDLDVTTATLPGARIAGSGLADWKEEELAFRKKGKTTKENSVVRLGWRLDPAHRERPASYAITLPPGQAERWRLSPGSLLSFAMADTGDDPTDPAEKTDPKAAAKAKRELEARRARDKGQAKEPLDLTVELVAADGTVARLPLSRFQPVPVALAARFTRLPGESSDYGNASEATLQTFSLPLADFVQVQPRFAPSGLHTVRFVFDRSPQGVVLLDEVGFAEPAPPAATPEKKRAAAGS